VLLARKLGLEGLLALGHRGLIPFRIDPHVVCGAGLDLTIAAPIETRLSGYRDSNPFGTC
jgi:hypothetical protein